MKLTLLICLCFVALSVVAQNPVAIRTTNGVAVGTTALDTPTANSLSVGSGGLTTIGNLNYVNGIITVSNGIGPALAVNGSGEVVTTLGVRDLTVSNSTTLTSASAGNPSLALQDGTAAAELATTNRATPMGWVVNTNGALTWWTNGAPQFTVQASNATLSVFDNNAASGKARFQIGVTNGVTINDTNGVMAYNVDKDGNATTGLGGTWTPIFSLDREIVASNTATAFPLFDSTKAATGLSRTNIPALNIRDGSRLRFGFSSSIFSSSGNLLITNWVNGSPISAFTFSPGSTATTNRLRYYGQFSVHATNGLSTAKIMCDATCDIINKVNFDLLTTNAIPLTATVDISAGMNFSTTFKWSAAATTSVLVVGEGDGEWGF